MSKRKALLNTEVGEVWVESGYQIMFSLDKFRVSLLDPVESHLLAGEICHVYLQSQGFTVSGAPYVLKLIGFVSQVAMLIDDANEERKLNLLQEREKQEEKQKQEIEARDKLIAERTELCLNDLVGEKIRVRSQGYKGSPRAKMTARERRIATSQDSDEDVIFEPFIVFDNEDVDGGRPRSIMSIRKLEVKRGNRYEVIWDDGDGDLPLWNREEAKEMML